MIADEGKVMRFARWAFLLAGVSGAIMMMPLYFLEERFSREHPPPINHPELYYGFAGVTLAWRGTERLVAFTTQGKPGGQVPLSGGARVERTRTTFVLRASGA